MWKVVLITGVLALGALCFALCDGCPLGSIFNAEAASPKSVLDFKVRDIDGKDVKLKKYKGKVLLMVNVASKCGYTPQYEGLQALYEKYTDKGFYVLGFPANNFGGQEPHRGRDQGILHVEIPRDVPDVRKDVGQGRGCRPAV